MKKTWIKIIQNLVQIFFILIITWVFIYNLYKPEILKPIIKNLAPTAEYEVSKYAKVFKNFTFYNNGEKNKKLLIWLNGGAFLFSENSSSYGFINNLFEKIKNCDILMINYPVRFDNTLTDAINHINEILKKFLHYEEYIGSAFSAGTLLMGTFISKELNPNISKSIEVQRLGLNFTKFIGINGIYSNNFDSSLLRKMFNFYVLRGTKMANFYNCNNLKIKKLIIGSSSDFLFNQTKKFLSTEKAETLIFENENLIHNFLMYQNISETNIVVNKVANFL